MAAYDAIARDYQRSKSSPPRPAIESWTSTVCSATSGAEATSTTPGDGFHARRLMAAGAKRIAGGRHFGGHDRTGAHRGAPRVSSGIQYQCCAVEDFRHLLLAGFSDVVLAAHPVALRVIGCGAHSHVPAPGECTEASGGDLVALVVTIYFIRWPTTLATRLRFSSQDRGSAACRRQPDQLLTGGWTADDPLRYLVLLPGQL